MPRLSLILAQLRQSGWRWLLARLRREWLLPTTAPGRLLARARRGRALGTRTASPEADLSGVLYAFYDLAILPVTFDFLWFLAGAELERSRSGAHSIHVVIVPGLENGLRREPPDYESVIDTAARRGRIAAMLVPACSFLTTVSGVTVAGDRLQAEAVWRQAAARVFPAEYAVAMPRSPSLRACLEAGRAAATEVAALRATPQDLAAVARWLAPRCGERRLVTITLRNYGYKPQRNSDLAAWTTFARGLDRDRYFVVFVPDLDQCLDGLPDALAGATVFAEAAWALGLRMALYEHAFLNLGINHGPMGLCWLNARTRYITFKLLTQSVPQTTVDYMRSLGFEPGRSLPFATAWQRWVWEEDSCEVIAREFAAMVRRIEERMAAPAATEISAS